MILTLPRPFSIACSLSNSLAGLRVVSIYDKSACLCMIERVAKTNLADSVQKAVLILDVHWLGLVQWASLQYLDIVILVQPSARVFDSAEAVSNIASKSHIDMVVRFLCSCPCLSSLDVSATNSRAG